MEILDKYNAIKDFEITDAYKIIVGYLEEEINLTREVAEKQDCEHRDYLLGKVAGLKVFFKKLKSIEIDGKQVLNKGE